MRISRRFGALAGALALATGVSFTFATQGGASGPAPIDVSNDHLTCTSFYGSFTFSPTLGGPAGSPMVATVKGTLDGCTDTNNANVHLLAAKVTGTVTYASNNAVALAGVANVTGSLKASWKTAKGFAKLTASTSTLNFSQENNGTASPGGNFTDVYAFFQMGTDGAHGSTAAPSVTGDFHGTDGGASSTFDALGSQSLTALLGPSGLGNPAGIKTAPLGVGQMHLG